MLTGATGEPVDCKGAGKVVWIGEIAGIMSEQGRAHPSESQMEVTRTKE